MQSDRLQIQPQRPGHSCYKSHRCSPSSQLPAGCSSPLLPQGSLIFSLLPVDRRLFESVPSSAGSKSEAAKRQAAESGLGGSDLRGIADSSQSPSALWFWLVPALPLCRHSCQSCRCIGSSVLRECFGRKATERKTSRGRRREV